jgi:hypothetical protein
VCVCRCRDGWRHSHRRCAPGTSRELENELRVLSDSYDVLVAKDPSTPQMFFAVAVYSDNQAVFKNVGANFGRSGCACGLRGCGAVAIRLWSVAC